MPIPFFAKGWARSDNALSDGDGTKFGPLAVFSCFGRAKNVEWGTI